MAKIDFPNNPVVNEIFEAPNGQTWKWDGKSWNSISASNLSGIDVSEFQLKNQLQGTVIGDLLPLGDETIDLGSPTKRFRDLYLSGNSLTIGTSVLSVDSTGDVFVDLNGSGSLVKLSVSDISELSDSSGVLDSAGGGGGGGGGISLTDLSIGSEGVAAGDGSLSYDNTTGVFTYTPPDLSSYLTSYTETDPVFSASDAAGITNANISNWNTAHGWGDHGAGGYLTSYTETSTLDDVITRGHLTTQTAVIPFYYADQASFPNATSYHGAIAHSHADGAMYFAHGGNWVKLANDSSLTETDPVFSASDAAGITSTDISNWNTAHGWGDHSLEGYLTSETTHADVLVDGDFNSSGIMVRGSNPGDYNVIVNSSSNWNDAYGWGDHGSAGYATSSDILDLQNQITNITGADSALDSFTELITYIRGLDSAQDLSLIQDVADLKSDSSNWDIAYGWGDHGSVGYLTSVTASDIGLGNVDNTSDLDKPISTATQAALDDKVDNSAVLTPVDSQNKIVTQSDISALGGGDMLQSVYDSNNDGKVNSADNADTVNNLTVETAVPVGALFTDTLYANSDVDFHLNRDSAVAGGQVLSWDSSGDYAWVDKGNTLLNISDNVQGVAVSAGSKLLTGDIEMDTGSILKAEGCTINFGSSTIVGNAFNSVINHHIWEGTTKPTDGYVLSWDQTVHAGDGGYEWVNIPAQTGDSNRVVYDLTDPASSVILDAGDGISHATYKGDVIDSAGNTIVDISSTSATFTGTLLGSVAGNSTTPTGSDIILNVGTDGTDGILTITNITADGTVDFTGATVIGLDSAGYATSSDILGLQSQINTILGSDTALDSFTELIDYIRDLEATDSNGELSLIQDIADLQANVLFDNDFDSAGLMVTDGAGTYSSITNNSSNWNTAYGWGNHALKGYLTTTTWTLTANGSSDYVFSGPGIETGNTNDPDIFLVRGQTYKFDNQSGGHPFEIRTSSGGSAYTSGVSELGTVTTFTVPMDAPDKLYYQCTSHPSMLGNIIISDYSKSLVDSDFDSAGLMVTDGAGTYSSITNNSSNWNTAYGWGDHSLVGYLTTSDLQDVLVDSDFDSAGLMVTDGAGNYSSITNNSSDWNTAYGWGDHSLVGYSKVEISDNAPSSPTAGDLWWNSNEGNLKIYYGNDTDTAGDDIWVDASVAGYSGGSGGSSSSITNGTNGINVTNNTTSGYNAIEFETDNGNTSGVRWRFTTDGHLLPSSNANFDIGSAEYKVRHLFLSDNSLYFGEQTDSAGEMLQFTKDNVERSVEVATENTAPVNENEPGNKGDMRIVEDGLPGGGYVYIHNGIKWVRSSLETTWNI